MFLTCVVAGLLAGGVVSYSADLVCSTLFTLTAAMPLGFGVAESLGTPGLDYVHPADRAQSQALIEPLLRRQRDY